MANSRPVAINDILPFMEFDVISGNLLANDTGPARFLRFLGDDRVEAKRGPDQITAIAGDHGTFFVKPDGSFTYELDPEVAASIGPGQMVIEQLQYKVSDGMGRTDVGILRLEISGAGAGTEVRTIDFEDLEPGTIVPDGYQGFDWGDGWTIETDDVGESGAGNHVAKPVQAVDSITWQSQYRRWIRSASLAAPTSTSSRSSSTARWTVPSRPWRSEASTMGFPIPFTAPRLACLIPSRRPFP
jgi:VCBS repeat-containing protein